jgi:hypothetical protein
MDKAMIALVGGTTPPKPSPSGVCQVCLTLVAPGTLARASSLSNLQTIPTDSVRKGDETHGRGACSPCDETRPRRDPETLRPGRRPTSTSSRAGRWAAESGDAQLPQAGWRISFSYSPHHHHRPPPLVASPRVGRSFFDPTGHIRDHPMVLSPPRPRWHRRQSWLLVPPSDLQKPSPCSNPCFPAKAPCNCALRMNQPVTKSRRGASRIPWMAVL